MKDTAIVAIKRHLKEAREIVNNDRNRDCRKIDLAMLRVLAEMAHEDICPNGEFSDAECVAWSILCEFVSK